MADLSKAAESSHINSGAETGRNAGSPAEMPFAGWKQVAVRTWKQSSEDNVGLVAAGVAFYGFLALVPLLGATVLTYGLVAAPQTVLANVKSLTSVMPADAATLIGEQLMSVVQSSGSKKGLGLLAALAVAIFGARNAAGSIITALNIAYEEEESRGFLRVTLLAIAITLAAVVLAVLAMIAIAAVGFLESLLPAASGELVLSGKVLTYALLLVGAAGAAATLYRYGPDRDKAKWTWITPGSLFSAVGWVVLTLGFGFYVSHFGNYDKTYGSLATVVILLTWMYLSSYVFIFGAELNSEFEHQTEQDTTAGAATPLGQRGAWSADHVAGSDEPNKASRGEASFPSSGGDVAHPSPMPRQFEQQPSAFRNYAASRVANHAGSIAGLQRVGMLSSAIATAGLALIRRRGKAGTGAALIAAAAGLSLLRRK